MQIRNIFTICSVILCASAHQNDVVYIIDISGSLSQADLNQSVDFLYDTTNWLTIGPTDINIAIVTFSDASNVLYNFNSLTDKNSVLNALNGIKSITTTGGTFTNLALDDAFDLLTNSSFGARANTNKTVVVLTDGLATNLLAAETSSNNLQNAGVEVYSVGVGLDFSSDQTGLQKISSDPDSYYIHYSDQFIYLCNIIPSLVPKLESGTTATIPSDCQTTTTTTQKSKGKVVVTTESTDTSTSTTASTTQIDTTQSTGTTITSKSTITTQTSQSTLTTQTSQSTGITQTSQSTHTTQTSQSTGITQTSQSTLTTLTSQSTGITQTSQSTATQTSAGTTQTVQSTVATQTSNSSGNVQSSQSSSDSLTPIIAGSVTGCVVVGTASAGAFYWYAAKRARRKIQDVL